MIAPQAGAAAHQPRPAQPGNEEMRTMAMTRKQSKCWRVWAANGSCILVNAIDEDDARVEARRLLGVKDEEITTVENLTD